MSHLKRAIDNKSTSVGLGGRDRQRLVGHDGYGVRILAMGLDGPET